MRESMIELKNQAVRLRRLAIDRLSFSDEQLFCADNVEVYWKTER
jgi:hypothetical protein